MRALVTGGCGFVGRHLVKAMSDMSVFDHIDVVDAMVPGTGCKFPEAWGGFHAAPNRHVMFHFEDCREFFNGYEAKRYDVVFHLAAIVGGRQVIENNPLSVAEDLEIDASMFRWAALAGDHAPHIVYFSSSAAYPISGQMTNPHMLLHEDMIDLHADDLGMPDLSYGWAKLTGEFLAQLAREKHGLKTTVYRPFSGYGPDQDLSYPFPSIMKRAALDEPMFVWGPGTQQRDFIHIDDCVDIVLQTWGRVDVLNLSTGIGTDFLQLARMALEAVGRTDDQIDNQPDQPVGVLRRVGSTAKQEQFISGFKPRSLEEGVRDGVAWWR